ncbi:MAG TPA: UDP-N-acetylmuramoyl-L-alanyl-D-glutamate--2,6-diaminopimelate ligase [Spirochaetota bacterium]|mgnify:FL=1|nr:UDP-N-acetylmuramoyl-L-alanyl-D-glutamate--2,6-diaminopimelate ligase [Spirochaetota bacterium]HOK93099.1 UDP-N-acetylmuramoyl-L-alanyl-D-glutamate--2,6-diaminopimelate ligase [Spirochaetota bacterium]HRS62127.1 UDP-N-acetylmuramoyl-L-alanyl-D-glutamate--2,6-diaminopimelate ligase [Spirochaetota bacterium]
MKLSELLRDCKYFLSVAGDRDVDSLEIKSIEYDSRKANGDCIFVAVKGFETDGHNYIEAAVEKGCKVILLSEDRVSDFIYLEDKGVIILVSHDTRRALSYISSVFYGRPSESLCVIGVTGTNGKTSITYLLESVFKSNGIKCGVIGTINYRWNDVCIPAPNTTPESKDIQELLRRMLDDGLTHVIMEVSSHALELNRVDDVAFDCGIFTNLTQDHLDFHKTFDCYFLAKKKLFELIDKSPKKNKLGLVNIDDTYGLEILNCASKYSFKLQSFGETSEADFFADPLTIKNNITGLSYKLICASGEFNLNLKIAGRFQVYNSLAAFGAGVFTGISPMDVVAGLEALESVPGRLQVVDAGVGFYAVVDYAHTGDALLKLLQSINEMPHNKVITVFGCGGDRDKTKRPLMGQIAVSHSDFAIVTSDNPRTEDPALIIKDIVAGISSDNYIVEQDREKAIAKAVSMAARGDVIVIAGKGHEDYQILGKEKHHFDDREVVLKYMREVVK